LLQNAGWTQLHPLSRLYGKQGGDPMTLGPMEEWEKPFFAERIYTCPLRSHSSNFQPVDE
ncbi:hypothetical protein N1E26_30715, partial [Pseudomonas aeruginosa]|nr:hypothetical protein [Pseudomonas aeruginosa]MCS8457912.1 hypothetical protein [Pseudomonas aeruginosa]MCS9593781.1 hypothetical protein [Pseudomonas aeruginosa]MCS9779471.1 hypothetical protein [Pseudomonas aeruginosa]MCS9791720.1 hypothetical protein [Pseudomonas aeruginosa]